MDYLIILLTALAFGWVSRMAGGAPPKIPLGLDQWIYALPYGLVPLYLGCGWVSVLSYAGAFLAKRTGHGQYLDLGSWTKAVNPEKLDFIVKLFFAKDTCQSYWRDVFGLFVTGMAVSLVAGILHDSILVALSGGLKAPAYMIGWLIYPKGHGKGILYLNEATAIGEFLTGFFCIGAYLLII